MSFAANVVQTADFKEMQNRNKGRKTNWFYSWCQQLDVLDAAVASWAVDASYSFSAETTKLVFFISSYFLNFSHHHKSIKQ